MIQHFSIEYKHMLIIFVKGIQVHEYKEFHLWLRCDIAYGPAHNKIDPTWIDLSSIWESVHTSLD